jgi:hypothetical protein
MQLQLTDYVAPVIFAIVSIILTSLIPEPVRQKFMVIMVAGASAAYISGGAMGIWEFPFTVLVSWCAYKGLRSYSFIGLGWLLHTGWDIVHHLLGHPIIPFSATSSLGCAIYDPVLAIWCFAGAPSVFTIFRGKRLETAG